jgi:hypothetical protein
MVIVTTVLVYVPSNLEKELLRMDLCETAQGYFKAWIPTFGNPT